LALAVFFIWLFWYQHHKKREDFPFEDRLASIAPQFLPKKSGDTKLVSIAQTWAQFQPSALVRWRRAASRMKPDMTVEERDIGTIAGGETRFKKSEINAMANGNTEIRLNRVDTIYPGVRR
jgi:hypothetical protein